MTEPLAESVDRAGRHSTAVCWPPASTACALIGLPLLIALFILFFSPNFAPSSVAPEGPSNVMRNDPLGGDFLQEWIGGRCFISGQAGALYDLDRVQAMQHDESLVGFSWPEKNYFPMVYPPFYYFAVSPLANLPYATAARVWILLMAAALSATGFILYLGAWPRSDGSTRRSKFPLILAVGLIYSPLLTSLNMGQKGTIWLAIFAGTFVWLSRGMAFSAGLTLGLLVFKPHLALVVGSAMLLKRQWHFVLGALAVVAVAVSLNAAIYPQLLVDYGRTVLGMQDYVETGGYQLADSHSLWATAQLALDGRPKWLIKVAACVLAGWVIGLLTRLLRGPLDFGSPRFAYQFSGLIIGTVMLSPHFYSYDLTILLLPMLLTVLVNPLTAATPVDEVRTTTALTTGGQLLVTTVAVFALSGLFRPLAESIGFQPSFILLSIWLWLLGTAARETSDHTVTAADSSADG